jgi:DNA-binding GntR family transcriptional regulator
MLLRGEIPLGAQLDERELAEQMGVSRTPLREAIVNLAREGIVEYRPYRGNFVRTFTAKQVDDLYQVRKALESLAVRLAVPKLSDEDIDHIGAILDESQLALVQGDIDGYSKADRRFHEFVARCTGNESLVDSLNRLSAQIQMVRSFANRDPEVVARTAQERPLILAAFRARDANAAARLMEEHIDGVRQSVIAQMHELVSATP